METEKVYDDGGGEGHGDGFSNINWWGYSGCQLQLFTTRAIVGSI